MGQFLNNKEPYDKYKTVMNGTFFVLPVRDVSEKQLWQI